MLKVIFIINNSLYKNIWEEWAYL